MQISFYPVEVSYKVMRDLPVIQMFGRLSDGNQVCVLDESFEPYFWMINSVKEDIEQVSAARNEYAVRIKRVEQHKKKFVGQEVNALKVFCFLPSDVPVLREAASAFGKVLEADIPFERRYLIDRGISPLSLCSAEGEFMLDSRSKVPVFRAEKVWKESEDILQELKVLAFDIETHSQFGTAIVLGEQPIIMLALSGNGFRKVLTWKRFATNLDFVEFVESEAELLKRFKELFEQFSPDVVAGYFSDGFDFPYLSARAAKHNINLDIGLDFSQPRIVKKPSVSIAEVAGIAHFDVFKFVRRIFGRSLQTPVFDLDSVAMEVLSEGKDNVDLSALYHAWNNNDGLESFCKYNLQDAQLVLKLAEKMLPNLVELVNVVGLSINDVSRMSFSQLVEWYLLNEAKNFNEIAPNRPAYVESRERIGSTFEGAYVYEPTPGLYEGIAVFDFRSLYPTIISAHNVSPDMMNCACCPDSELVPGAQRWFCRKRKGFISTVIENLVKRRMRIKEIMRSSDSSIMLKARSEALKTIANSIYGYFGFFGARWYSVECAKSITAYGRKYIMDVISNAKAEGFGVLYSDTDSIFLSLSGKSSHEAESFVTEINRHLPGLMELDYEGFYPSGLFVGTKDKGLGAKKKYALLTESGSLKIRGFETVRRNLSRISKEVQEKVLTMVLKEKNDESAREYVRGIIEQMRNKELPVEKMVINTQLQKEIASYDSISPHVAVAQRMRQLGRKVGIGSMISYVVVKGKDRIRDRARLPEEVKEGEYDPEYYIQNQILPSVGKIFDVFGTNIQDFIEPKVQSKLDSFFAA